VGRVSAVQLPKGAHVVDAQGKYLIPGLWDVHSHPLGWEATYFYPLLLAHGVTGIRNPGSGVPLDTLLQLRREVLAGTRVGPPRQILSGPSLGGSCSGGWTPPPGWPEHCVTDSANARHKVDSLKAAGADMIKPREVTREMYFVIAAEARRLGIPFGGHAGKAYAPGRMTAFEASDSGARIVDHAFPGRIGDTCGLGQTGGLSGIGGAFQA
jgi:hypothetical protein